MSLKNFPSWFPSSHPTISVNGHSRSVVTAAHRVAAAKEMVTVKLPGFTAGLALRESSPRSGNLRIQDMYLRTSHTDPGPESSIMPASYWGWWDSSCGWNCTPQLGKRQIRAVLYDIPSGWDWSAACRSAWGPENRPPDSCMVGLFGPPPGYVVEGQWWIPWSN